MFGKHNPKSTKQTLFLKKERYWHLGHETKKKIMNNDLKL